jgi:drug/metabolite transporter (DMT)-like permease
MKTAIVILLFVLAEVIGNTCLSGGMKQVASAGVGEGALSLQLILQAMVTPLIWVGIVLLLAYFALFAAALSWADLSFVLPASAFKYILNVAFAGWFLGEPVSSSRWAGTALICVGVFLVARTAGDRSVEAAPGVAIGAGEGGRP